MECANRPAVVKGRPSTVVPAKSTGYNVTHSLNGLDISLRPHYIRCVYYYSKHAVDGCSTSKWKESLFYVLNGYPVVAGRSNYADNNVGGSHIRCSDNGIRFVEAECNATLEDCIDFKDSELESELSSTQTISPDLSTSPLALIQVTRFKCGGVSIGLTWAHVLGDALSASVFMNTWGGIVRGINNISNPPIFERILRPSSLQFSESCEESVKSKIVESDRFWPPEIKTSMARATFRFTHAKIEETLSKLAPSNIEETHLKPIITPFEVISALIWQIITRIRGPAASKALTLCTDFRKVVTADPNGKSGYHFGNYQTFLNVSLEGDEVVPSDTDDLPYLVKVIHEAIAERVNTQEIDRMAEWPKNEKQSSMAMYGSELTFVNWENIPCYDMMLKGEGRPLHASYTVDGVGAKGAVVVLPSSSSSIEGGAKDRIVNVTLVREELARLEEELYRHYSSIG